MKWHQVMAAAIAECVGSSTLAGIYGAAMRHTGSGDLIVPVLEWQLIADAESELWVPCTVQYDQWCRTMSELAESEQALRRLFHRDLPTDFGGLIMWAQYVDGGPLVDAPNRDGYFARAIRFRFTPLRDRYSTAPTP